MEIRSETKEEIGVQDTYEKIVAVLEKFDVQPTEGKKSLRGFRIYGTDSVRNFYVNGGRIPADSVAISREMLSLRRNWTVAAEWPIDAIESFAVSIHSSQRERTLEKILGRRGKQW